MRTRAGAVTTFQNLTRATYPCLQSKVYQATDFGPASETPSDGTPCSWDLGTVSDAIDEAETASGKKVGGLFVHGELAKAMDRLNKATNGVSVTVGSIDQAAQAIVGTRNTRTFEKSDGSRIPIYICRTLPRNVLYGLAIEVMGWHPEQDFDWLRLYGNVWGPTKDDRYANFEAPYYGSYNLSSQRCDGHLCIQDMSTAV